MNNDQLISSVYLPPRSKHDKNIDDFYADENNIRYYSLARHALKNGLRALNLKEGDIVLIPSFICRDVLAPFNELKLNIRYYSLNQDLTPNLPIHVDKVKAILAVHYFGLETNLIPFLDFCKTTGAYLIEDNAHGLFSRDQKKSLLGTNGDIGIISLRKTLPIANGGMLLLKSKFEAPLQLDILPIKNVRLRIKELLRPLVAKVGISPLMSLTRLKRVVRKTVKGDAMPVSQDMDEYQIPLGEHPTDIQAYFRSVNVDSEIKRRRDLFSYLHHELKGLKINPLKNQLGPFEVPYGYPFFCTDSNIEDLTLKLRLLGLECMKWPALPKEVRDNCPDFYNQLYLVKFIW